MGERNTSCIAWVSQRLSAPIIRTVNRIQITSEPLASISLKNTLAKSYVTISSPRPGISLDACVVLSTTSYKCSIGLMIREFGTHIFRPNYSKCPSKHLWETWSRWEPLEYPIAVKLHRIQCENFNDRVQFVVYGLSTLFKLFKAKTYFLL